MDPRITAWKDRVDFRASKIDALDREVGELLEHAQKAPFPGKVRPAVAADIVEGAVIWYKSEKGSRYFWTCVEALYMGWKSHSIWVYRGTDGTLHRWQEVAFVEVEDAT